MSHDKTRIKHLLHSIDLTYLGEHDAAKITALCEQAKTPWGHVAAICVYPEALSQVKSLLPEVPLATVVNFPHGQDSIDKVELALEQAKALGTDEIDVVMPYHLYQDGPHEDVLAFLQRVRHLCAGLTLKVIIESGMLPSLEHVAWATQDVIKAQADFVKTSTGKVATGATLEAVSCIVREISAAQSNCGIKVSGGVRTVEEALAYVDVVASLGEQALSPQRFRIGASQLLTDCVQHLTEFACQS